LSTISDSTLTVLAGSDTTSTVLRNIMYFLLAYPEYFDKLRKEIDESFPYGDGEEEIEVGKLSSMKLLNGVMCVFRSSI
jgi:cytochrome P450